jgi:hypothetical protein
MYFAANCISVLQQNEKVFCSKTKNEKETHRKPPTYFSD